MVNYRGELIPGDSNFFNHTNRGFRFGDALFEEIRVIHGLPVFWEAHYFRLMAAMRILRMEIPMEFTMEFLQEQLLKTVAANGMDKKPALLRITVFREGGTEVNSVSAQVSYVIDAVELPGPFYTMGSAPYEVELFKDHTINADMLSNLSTCHTLLPTLASIYAVENGYSDCLLINVNKQVVGTIYGNLFLVKDNMIKTPPLQDGCTNSVLRKRLIEIVEAMASMELMEESISPFELQKADELFMVNIRQGIVPITRYRKKEYQQKTAVAVLGKLNVSARLLN